MGELHKSTGISFEILLELPEEFVDELFKYDTKKVQRAIQQQQQRDRKETIVIGNKRIEKKTKFYQLD